MRATNSNERGITPLRRTLRACVRAQTTQIARDPETGNAYFNVTLHDFLSPLFLSLFALPHTELLLSAGITVRIESQIRSCPIIPAPLLRVSLNDVTIRTVILIVWKLLGNND